MVNKRIRAAAALKLVRKVARRHGLTVVHVPGRGKGSHQIYALRNSADREVARLGLTDHPRELSWTVLGQIEGGLAFLFGERWMEER